MSIPLEYSDETFMRRALQLARLGAGSVSPNPMVGAVIVAPGGRIIGEGYHRRYGEAHAEVNAVASVKPQDRHLLPDSTIYVTLEPCSHYGKTPPCAKLIVETGLKRVVAATLDPNPKVSGRGMDMVAEAGIETSVGLLANEAESLNRRFMTAHRLQRPWVQLKWAQSADGFMARKDACGNPAPTALSTPLTAVWMHRQRALAEAIMVGKNTMTADRPSLTTRLWPGNSPRKVLFASAGARESAESRDSAGPAQKDLAGNKAETIGLQPHSPLLPQLQRLYHEYGITSLMVEGGAETLSSFLREDLADELRVETSPIPMDNDGCVRSPFAKFCEKN